MSEMLQGWLDRLGWLAWLGQLALETSAPDQLSELGELFVE